MHVSAEVVSCCIIDKPPEIMQHMRGNNPNMFDWSGYLLLLKT